MESWKRSLLKAITYRFFSFITTTLIALVLTRSVIIACQFAIIDGLSKIAVYFLHERIWSKIKYGKGHCEYEI